MEGLAQGRADRGIAYSGVIYEFTMTLPRQPLFAQAEHHAVVLR